MGAKLLETQDLNGSRLIINIPLITATRNHQLQALSVSPAMVVTLA